MSYPLRACSDCGSESITTGLENPNLDVDTLLCLSCGTLHVFEEFDWACPHCSEPLNPGATKCPHCGLYATEDYNSREISPLWRNGSEIKAALSENDPKLGLSTELGKFLRKECGPHCVDGYTCTQTKAKLAKCYNKDRREKIKRSIPISTEQYNYGAYSLPGNYKPAAVKPPSTYVVCCSVGWLRSNVYETNNIQQNTGGKGHT